MRHAVIASRVAWIKMRGWPVFEVSTVTREGLRELTFALWDLVAAYRAAQPPVVTSAPEANEVTAMVANTQKLIAAWPRSFSSGRQAVIDKVVLPVNTKFQPTPNKNKRLRSSIRVRSWAAWPDVSSVKSWPRAAPKRVSVRWPTP